VYGTLRTEDTTTKVEFIEVNKFQMMQLVFLHNAKGWYTGHWYLQEIRKEKKKSES
jgi:hypothetical protein